MFEQGEGSFWMEKSKWNHYDLIISHFVLCCVLGSPVNSPLGGEEGPSGIKTTLCPVCEEVIHGNGDELNSHVETCLRKVLSVHTVYVITCIIMGLIKFRHWPRDGQFIINF